MEWWRDRIWPPGVSSLASNLTRHFLTTDPCWKFWALVNINYLYRFTKLWSHKVWNDVEGAKRPIRLSRSLLTSKQIWWALVWSGRASDEMHVVWGRKHTTRDDKFLEKVFSSLTFGSKKWPSNCACFGTKKVKGLQNQKHKKLHLSN